MIIKNELDAHGTIIDLNVISVPKVDMITNKTSYDNLYVLFSI